MWKDKDLIRKNIGIRKVSTGEKETYKVILQENIKMADKNMKKYKK